MDEARVQILIDGRDNIGNRVIPFGDAMQDRGFAHAAVMDQGSDEALRFAHRSAMAGPVTVHFQRQ